MKHIFKELMFSIILFKIELTSYIMILISFQFVSNYFRPKLPNILNIKDFITSSTFTHFFKELNEF